MLPATLLELWQQHQHLFIPPINKYTEGSLLCARHVFPGAFPPHYCAAVELDSFMGRLGHKVQDSSKTLALQKVWGMPWPFPLLHFFKTKVSSEREMPTRRTGETGAPKWVLQPWWGPEHKAAGRQMADLGISRGHRKTGGDTISSLRPWDYENLTA